MVTCFKVLATLTICLLIGVRLQAEDTAAPTDEAQIARWVKQLDDDDFAVREAASKALVAAGPIAVPLVSQAAQGECLEASTRAFRILDQWLCGGEQQTQVAARDSLVSLAETGNGGNAQRLAKAILTKNGVGSEYDLGEMDAEQFEFLGVEMRVPEFMLEAVLEFDGAEVEFAEVEEVPAVVKLGALEALMSVEVVEAEPDAIWKDFILSVEPPVLEVESSIDLQLPELETAE
jgi:hypothetical protein